MIDSCIGQSKEHFMSSYPSGIVTFLFTDIEGSTKLAHTDNCESLRARHNAILKTAIESHKGFVFQIIWDSFCANVSLSPALSEDWVRLVYYEMPQLLIRKSI
jgi:class 3 adenylate cyclase